jgi:hypothetical protein
VGGAKSGLSDCEEKQESEGMTPEELFHELLGLGVQWRVTRCEFEVEEGLVRLWIEETPRLWEAESIASGEAVACYDHVEEVVWRHLNVFEHRCEIHCRLPRGRRVCDAAGKVYRVTPPWEGLAKHFTKGFEAMVLLLLWRRWPGMWARPIPGCGACCTPTWPGLGRRSIGAEWFASAATS